MKSYTKLLFFILLVLCSFPSKTSAQKAKISASIDTTRMLIGDQINIVYELEHQKGLDFGFPIFKDTLLKNLEVLRVSSIDSQSLENNLIKLTQRVLVTSFDTGFYIIPSQYFVNLANQDSLKSEAFPLEVLTLELDTSKGITDIKLPYDIPLTFMEILPYIIVGLLLIGIIILLLYFLKKRKEKPAPLPRPKPAEPPHLWALRELDELAKLKLWQKGKTKLFHSRLSEIIRSYVEFRFDIRAMEQTSSEIIDALKIAKVVDYELLENLHQSMELSDLVKFAKWNPIPEENEKTMEMAYEFIYKTKKTIDLRKENSKETNSVEKEVGDE